MSAGRAPGWLNCPAAGREVGLTESPQRAALHQPGCCCGPPLGNGTAASAVCPAASKSA